jgi:hypothetical protein
VLGSTIHRKNPFAYTGADIADMVGIAGASTLLGAAATYWASRRGDSGETDDEKLGSEEPPEL